MNDDEKNRSMDIFDAARRLRVQYPGAIYHAMSRGVSRSNIFINDDDRNHFFNRCEATVERFDWRVYAAVQMTNHFHLLFKTPQPNLCRGMQFLLGPYARAFNRRHRRSGHLLEGRYCCRVIEDESYLWGVSRYDHLNPVPAIVDHPAQWQWSSYPGYTNSDARLPWVAYHEFLNYWRDAFGSGAKAYCDYVEAGMANGAEVGMPEAIDDWIIGSEAFAQRIRKLVSPASNEPTVKRVRDRPKYSVDQIQQAVQAEFKIGSDVLHQKSSRHPARKVFALLARQFTPATLEDVAKSMGLSSRDSIHKTIQHARDDKDPRIKDAIEAIKKSLRTHQD